jgi:uncharacterized protein with PIN domain
MLTVNIHDAKTNLSRLVEVAAKGEPFIIAKAIGTGLIYKGNDFALTDLA